MCFPGYSLTRVEETIAATEDLDFGAPSIGYKREVRDRISDDKVLL
jgi:hypothetical protein